ncbi:hypothetical protein ACLPJF_18680 [Pseudomonas vlassakiae]|uniref:hypothetical protein n=1 Tax=Pseudomonas TaxID=286 RepID=UPI00117B10AB|nr:MULTISPECIES: hypothetical protein [unclassified Pseudomonas]MBS3185321.1 hypothetical protein [Pseudomonas sp. PCH44]
MSHSFASLPFGETVSIDGNKAGHEGLPGRSLGQAQTLLCIVGGRNMPERERRYRAYTLLRELDSLVSSTMNQVAYGRLGGPDWQAMCEAHRSAFKQWIEFAESLPSASEAGEGRELPQMPLITYTKL